MQSPAVVGVATVASQPLGLLAKGGRRPLETRGRLEPRSRAPSASPQWRPPPARRPGSTRGSTRGIALTRTAAAFVNRYPLACLTWAWRTPVSKLPLTRQAQTPRGAGRKRGPAAYRQGCQGSLHEDVMVGRARFELAVSWSQTRRFTELSHRPTATRSGG